MNLKDMVRIISSKLAQKYVLLFIDEQGKVPGF